MNKTHDQRLKFASDTSSRMKCLGLLSASAIMACLPIYGHAQTEPAATGKTAASAKAAPGNPDTPTTVVTVKKTTRTKTKKANPNEAGKATAQCSGEMKSAFFNTPQGKWVTLDLKKQGLSSPAWIHMIEDPSLLKINPKFSRAAVDQFFVYGQKIGATNMIIKSKDGTCSTIALSIGIDTAAVQAKLAEVLPGEKYITVTAAADSLVLTGMVADAPSVDMATSIAHAFLRQSKASGDAASKNAGNAADGSSTQGATQIVVNTAPSAPAGTGAGGGKIINMLSVAAPQQVMLEVKIAEVSKTLLNKLGAKFNWTGSSGSWTSTFASSLLTGTVDSPNPSISFSKGTGKIIELDAQKKDGLIRILAEPNLMAISGQEGSFLAGGKIYIPVPQSGVGGSSMTLEEKEYGVGLKFLPTVLSGGRINIRVSPEVSELSRLEVSGSGGLFGTNTIIPVITTRRAATTVQLYDGQSFAIGGLIKNNTAANINALPGLGEVPVLGALFRSTDFQEDRTELLFVITPRLVKPLQANYSLPTDNITAPSNKDLFLNGRLEGSDSKSSPVTQPGAKLTEPNKPANEQSDQPQPNGPVGFE